VMAADAFGRRQAHVAYVYTASGRVAEAVLTAEELEDHRDHLTWIYDEAQAGARTPRPGAHCAGQYCPAVHVCPAVRGAASAANIVPADRLAKGIQTAEDVEAWLELKPQVERAVKELDKRAKALCDASGGRLDLPGGGAYVASERQRTSLDQGLLEEELGDLARFKKTTTYKVYAARAKAARKEKRK